MKQLIPYYIAAAITLAALIMQLRSEINNGQYHVLIYMVEQKQRINLIQNAMEDDKVTGLEFNKILFEYNHETQQKQNLKKKLNK